MIGISSKICNDRGVRGIFVTNRYENFKGRVVIHSSDKFLGDLFCEPTEKEFFFEISRIKLSLFFINWLKIVY